MKRCRQKEVDWLVDREAIFIFPVGSDTKFLTASLMELHSTSDVKNVFFGRLFLCFFVFLA